MNSSPYCSRLSLIVVAAALSAAGCTMSPRQYWESLKGEGFPEWSEKMSGVRGDTTSARPSGFFTDRRSEQIEKDLGGGF
jgi:hypothetical protein